jgi:PST family polysaccharide transporter
VLLNTDYLIVGRVLGAEALGLYTLAFKLPDLLLVNLCWVLSRVLFPFFSRLVDDRQALRAAYLAAFRFVSLVAVPLGLGLAATAPSVVSVLFGAQWSGAVPTMQVLAIYSTLHAISFHAGDVLKAVGRGGVLVRLSLVSVALLVPSMLAGVAWFGLVGVALAWIVVDSARFALSLRALQHEIDIDAHHLFASLRPPLVAGLAMLACVWFVGDLLGEPGLLVLVAQGMTGLVSYSAVLYVLNPTVVTEVRTVLGLLRHRAPATSPRPAGLDDGPGPIDA